MTNPARINRWRRKAAELAKPRAGDASVRVSRWKEEERSHEVVDFEKKTLACLH